MCIKTVPILRSSQYENNITRLGEHSDTCICCGKRTATNLTVHLTTDFEIVNTTKEDLSEIDTISQGFFNIGKECAKKFPSEFIFKS